MTRLESSLRRLGDDVSRPAPPDLADRALARARRRTRVHGAQAAAAVTVIAVLTTFGVNTAIDQGRKPAPTGPATSAAAAGPGGLKARENVLVLGVDAAEDRIGTRPDTIMLAGVDTRTGTTTLLSLPRNLQRVPFPPGSPGAKAWPQGFDCGSDCLLNTVWNWAEKDDKRSYGDDPHPGLTATTQAVEQITGLTVDDTVVVNLRGLSDLVNAVGGVDVTVRERLPIGGNTHDQRARGWIEAGRQRLNGDQALWYARSRWTTSDDDRIGRQQCLIGALLDQVDAGALIRNLPKIARAIGPNLSTSIDPDDLAAWADLAPKARDAGVRRVTLRPADAAHPDYAALRQQASEAIGGRTAHKSSGASGKGLSGGAC